MMSEQVFGRTVVESQAERSEIIFPADSNALGNLFGGRLMQYIDLVGAMAASRHARAIVVTASMDHLDFVAPVKVGDGAYVGAGSTVAEDVAPDALAVVRAERVEKPGWAEKFRTRKKAERAAKGMK